VRIVWDEDAWDDYLWQQQQDRKIVRRMSALIQDIQGLGNQGIGKPEALGYGLHDDWSRRIAAEHHRLVYRVTDEESRVASCRFHYDD